MSEKLFNVGVKGVITKGNKILLLNNRKGFWDMPGGRVDEDETLMETLDRELKEEIPNVKNVKINEIVGATRIHRNIFDNVGLTLIFYKIEADIDGEPQLSEEHSDYKWLTKTEALKIVNNEYKEVISKLQV